MKTIWILGTVLRHRLLSNILLVTSSSLQIDPRFAVLVTHSTPSGHLFPFVYKPHPPILPSTSLLRLFANPVKPLFRFVATHFDEIATSNFRHFIIITSPSPPIPLSSPPLFSSSPTGNISVEMQTKVVASSDLAARREARKAYDRPWLQKPASKFDFYSCRVFDGSGLGSGFLGCIIAYIAI